MRALLVLMVMAVNTLWMGLAIIVASALGMRRPPFNLYEALPRLWSRVILRVAGVRLRLHDPERMTVGTSRVFVCNHVSWFDVFALAAVLPHYRFVAKKELFRIPIFGPAVRASVAIEIDRQNRKAAFQAYEVAAQEVREGRSVIVFPEGTRGFDYCLRAFKKGPFVLAIAAHVPIVPTVVHGTIEIMRKKSFRIRPGVIDVHFLEPVATEGTTYDDRDELVHVAWERMATALERYGVQCDRGVIDSETTEA